VRRVFSRQSRCAAANSVPSSTATATASATRSSFHVQRPPSGGRAAVAAQPSPSPTTSPRRRRAAPVGAVARSPGPPSGRARTVGRSESSGSQSASTARVDGRPTVVVTSKSSRNAPVPPSRSTEPSSSAKDACSWIQAYQSIRLFAPMANRCVKCEQKACTDSACLFLHLKRFAAAAALGDSTQMRIWDFGKGV